MRTRSSRHVMVSLCLVLCAVSTVTSTGANPDIDSVFRDNNKELQQLEATMQTGPGVASRAQATASWDNGLPSPPALGPPPVGVKQHTMLENAMPGAGAGLGSGNGVGMGLGASSKAPKGDVNPVPVSQRPPYVPTLLRRNDSGIAQWKAQRDAKLQAYNAAVAAWKKERDAKMRRYHRARRKWSREVRQKKRRHPRSTPCPPTFSRQVKALLIQWDKSVAKLMSSQACKVLRKFVESLARAQTYVKFYNYVRGGHSVYFRPVCGKLGMVKEAARRHGITIRGRNLQVPLLRDQAGPVPATGRKPSRQHRQDLRIENAAVLKQLSKKFRKKLKKILRALAGPTYKTYIRLSDPIHGGHVVDYDLVYGRPAAVREVGELLDLRVSRGQIQMGGRHQRVEAEAVEGGIEPTLVMPKPNEPI